MDKQTIFKIPRNKVGCAFPGRASAFGRGARVFFHNENLFQLQGSNGQGINPPLKNRPGKKLFIGFSPSAPYHGPFPHRDNRGCPTNRGILQMSPHRTIWFRNQTYPDSGKIDAVSGPSKTGCGRDKLYAHVALLWHQPSRKGHYGARAARGPSPRTIESSHNHDPFFPAHHFLDQNFKTFTPHIENRG